MMEEMIIIADLNFPAVVGGDVGPQCNRPGGGLFYDGLAFNNERDLSGARLKQQNQADQDSDGHRDQDTFWIHGSDSNRKRGCFTFGMGLCETACETKCGVGLVY